MDAGWQLEYNPFYSCFFATEMEVKVGVSGQVGSTHQSVSSSSSSSSLCVSVGTNTDISGDLPSMNGGLNELNIEGALTDELKLLQVNTHTKTFVEYIIASSSCIVVWDIQNLCFRYRILFFISGCKQTPSEPARGEV